MSAANDEGLAGDTAQAFRDTEALDGIYSAIGPGEEQAADACAKAFATLQAHLALSGFTLTELGGGGYLISRWDRTAHLDDLRGVREFLHRVGGGNG
jgi:hypothetical protein